MQLPITLFVCEFITGGGLQDALLPKSLVIEGLLMRDALLRDLHTLPKYQLVTTHDCRLKPSEYVDNSIEINSTVDVWSTWESCMLTADCVWLIAPETNGILGQLTAMAERLGKPVIGANLHAVEIASSKYLTYQWLKKSNIQTVPTWFYPEWQLVVSKYSSTQLWLAKPNDGAGCELTFIFEHKTMLSKWFNQDATRVHSHVIQPYQIGTPASISVLGNGETCIVLSCNLQHIEAQQNTLHYKGGVVNGALDYFAEMTKLAQQVQTALPGLRAYYGLDILLPSRADEAITLLEINPRLTTTYAKLANAMNANPAELILNVCLDAEYPLPAFEMNRVDFMVQEDA